MPDGQTAPVDIEATPANIALIDRINRQVNQQIEPQIRHAALERRRSLGPADGRLWRLRGLRALKRKLLIEAGLPRSALLITIVRDEMNEGHAILTVKTSRGDLILDNMNDDMKLWSRTPYRFIKRQSQEDQNVWIRSARRSRPRA